MSDVVVTALASIVGAAITGGATIYVQRSSKPVVYVPFQPNPIATVPPPAPEAPLGTPVEVESSSPSKIATQPQVSLGATVVDTANQTVVVKKRSAAFVIGLIGLIAWFLPIIGVPLAGYGLWLARKHSKMRDLYTHVDPAIWLNVMALTAGLVNAALGAAMAT